MKLIWTKHAEFRQREWEKRLGVIRDEVEELIKRPQQIAPGDLNVLSELPLILGYLKNNATKEALPEMLHYWRGGKDEEKGVCGGGDGGFMFSLR